MSRRPTTAMPASDRISLCENTWILPLASWRSMNIPLLRFERIRPAIATRSWVSAFAGRLS